MSCIKNFHIKRASQSDTNTIISIVQQSFVQYCNAIGLATIEALQESEQNVLHDILTKNVYLAYLEMIPVGSIRVELKNKKAFVSRFAILPEYQSLGIGSEMLSFIEKTLISLRMDTIELYSAIDNIQLKDFYTNKGYIITSIEDSNGYKRGLFEKVIR